MGLPSTRTAAARSLRLLALATVLDDLADGGAAAPPPSAASAPSLDALLKALCEHGGVSDSACVCALVYLGRVDAGACPGLALTHANLAALLIGALAIASSYVDRRHPHEVLAAFARAVPLKPAAVAVLRDSLAERLRFQTYISPATFREYDDILDDIVDVR